MHFPYHLLHVPFPPSGQLYPRRWQAAFFLCFAGLVAAFDMSVTSVALPAIADALRASTSDLQFIVDGYAVVFAGLLLLGGGLADRYGRKGVFMTGAFIFGVASIVGAFARSPQELIVARVLMGLGAALFLPPTLSIITVLFPPEERSRAIAIWAAFCGIGVAVGPVISGFLLERFWWGSVFFVNVPCCAIAALGTAVLVPTSRRPDTPSLDWMGAALSVASLGALLYGIIQGPNLGWLDRTTLATLAVGVLTLVAFVLWELRARHPMFDVRVFGLAEVSAGAMALFLLYFTYLGMLFVVPQYLQVVEGHSPLAAGVMMLPVGIMFIVFTQISPWLLERLGVRATLVGSMSLMGVGLLVISLLRWFEGYAVVALGGALFGIGIAVAMPPASTVVINALPPAKAGDGSDVNLISRQVGGSFGVAVIGSVFAAIYAAHISAALTGASLEAARAAEHSFADTVALAESLPAPEREALLSRADRAFETAAQIALLVGAALAVLGAALASWLLRTTVVRAPAVAKPGMESAPRV